MDKNLFNKLEFETIESLITNTCASISMRTQEEISKNILSENEKQKYIDKILANEKIKVISRLVAPGGHIQLALNNDFSEVIGFTWFDFYELSARMGVLTNKSPFYKHFKNLFEKVLETKGNIFKDIDKKGFVNWSSYSGLALEDDWIKKQRKINDLVFRCCLIDSIINNY